jgi:hypothetical protein
MSLRLPPVSETASGMPCASVIRWCLEPARTRSTGLAPVLGRPSPPAHASCQSPPWTSPAPRRRSAPPAAAHAAAATRLPHASPAAAASSGSIGSHKRPARSTVTVVPSSQRASTSTRPPVFPRVNVLGRRQGGAEQFRLSSHGLAVRCRPVPLFWTRRGIRAGGRVDGDAVEDSIQTPEVLLKSPCRSWSQLGSVSLARSLPIVVASSPRPCEK